MTPGFHKPGDEQPRRDDRNDDRRDDRNDDRRDDAPREERPARFERNDDAPDRGGDTGPRNDANSNIGSGYGKAAPESGDGGFRRNRWAPPQDSGDRRGAPLGPAERGDFRQNSDRGDRAGFAGGDRGFDNRRQDDRGQDRRFDNRRPDDRRPDDRRTDKRSSDGRADYDSDRGGYQGRSYGGDNIGSGYGKGRPEEGAQRAPRDDRGSFDRDDRGGRDQGGFRSGNDQGGYRNDDRNAGGYQQRGDFRGRDDRDGGGYQQRDDFRGRDDRSRDDRSGGYQQREDFRGSRDNQSGGGYRGRANDYNDRDQRGGFDREQNGGFDRDQRGGNDFRGNDRDPQGGGQESRSQEWKRMTRNDRPDDRQRFDDRRQDNRFDDRRGRDDRRGNDRGGFGESRARATPPPSKPEDKRRYKPPSPPNLDKDALQEPIRLNKYVARSTRYSRKESDDLVKRGRVTVNGEIVGPGTMIEPGDVVLFDEKPISRRDHLVYILINKPRGVEAAMAAPANPEATDVTQEENTWENDDNQRSAGTLTQVLKFKGTEALSVVHPLAAEMLGLQLVTNDPELAKHFAKHLPKESYTLDLSEPLDPKALEALPKVEGNQAGILLAEFLDEERTKVSIVGRGEFPARELEAAGIAFAKADRLHFAGLTKKDLPRGHWRFLGEREITWVTMFQQ